MPGRSKAFYEQGLQFVYDRPQPEYMLSPPELTVLSLIGEGHSIGDIAELVCVSVETVQRRKRSIKRKLKIKTDAELGRAYASTQTAKEYTQARYLAERVLPILAGATVLSPILRDERWCGLLVRLRSGATKRLWFMATEVDDFCGWVVID